MRILYAIQGTGNGHVSRARDIVPELQRYGTVDVLLSGYQVDLPLPLPVKYRLKGLSFIFGKKGGVSIWETAKRLRLVNFLHDVTTLPVHHYDLVINDFEPVSAWACRFRGVPVIGLSHQAAVLHPSAPKPAVSGLAGRMILKHYAPCTLQYGFHFERFDRNVFMPVIRRQVQELEPVNNGHYTVYLPAFDDERICALLHTMPKIKWQVFSKHNRQAFTRGNIQVQRVTNDDFLKSLASCEGALLGGGFEGPAEALFMKKKLMVVPMKGQYEQQCNAAVLASLGIPVLHGFDRKALPALQNWTTVTDWPVVPIPGNVAGAAVSALMEDYNENVLLSGGGMLAGPM